MSPHITSCVDMLLYVLRDGQYTTEVKTIAIVAIGDLCLVAEQEFKPHFCTTMESLKAAAMMAATQIELQQIDEDGAKSIQLLRKSLVEAFMSMVNGIKSPSRINNDINKADDEFQKQVHEHISTMFFYLDSIMQLEDLEIDADFGTLILDLYCDIVFL